ncbi:GH36-type glycosyl hydrolase domain-containing protein [Ferruginibacter sp.]|uniref:GH36-type glycosyl hydrolase domain-containing protein n=1 Tax=Ferruginibacter sp. TaxID=1940288 RepID=UPI00374D8194
MMSNQRKNKQTDLFEMLPQAIAALKKNIIVPIFGDGRSDKYANERPPLRSELFTELQLEQHASAISRKHQLISGHPSEQLLKRLAENENILLQVHAALTEAVKNNTRIVPAGEWLLDNFYLIEEQIYTGKKHLPKGYSKGLPQLLKGESAGLPRVYDIAVEIISHSDGHVDLNSLVSFVTAYQTNTWLKLGELWAIPIMLRLALIENLRRLSIQIASDIINKTLANKWADNMMDAAKNDPKNLVLVIADMARSEPPMDSAFVAELTRRLQEKGNALSLPLNWIEQRLSEDSLTSNELIHQENQKQAADQVSISNSISSLRFLSTTDWREFVENTSIVEQVLRRDINGVYAQMDFYTRDNYRHVVEKIAKKSSLTEKEVAEMVLQLAEENAQKTDDPRLIHVGYFLTCEGLVQMQQLSKMQLSKIDLCKKIFNKIPLLIYAGGIVLMSALLSWYLVYVTYKEGVSDKQLIIVGILILLATSRLSVAVINWLANLIAQPFLLPRMNFSNGIPQQHRSMVVVPTILSSVEGINDLAEGLEVRFLANRDEHLQYALVTDFKDALTENLPEDKLLEENVRNKIIELNKKYDRQTNDTFFLFHRNRKYNAKDKIWMGYERKRGKLAELNSLILGNDQNYFSLIVGDEAIYRSVKYIITLDTDTQLPRDAGWKMVATLAHPLNCAEYSQKKKRVTNGYTILQPRVSNSLPGSCSSIYTKIHGNEPGTDPYTRATSDVYQDLFKEGSFIGKGIYNVAAFENALHNVLPDNSILSHDLLEGCYTRSGLITDIQLYEAYPTRYSTDMQRRHRWIRGDWQIANWILPFVPAANKNIVKNPLSLLSKWKIFDNIRRSLIPQALLLLLLYGWVFSPAPIFWTVAVSLIVLLPAIISFCWSLINRPADVLFSQHFIFSFRSASDQFYQYVIELFCLPYEAFSNTDAILRTLWRMFISHKNLLQWNSYHSTLAYNRTIAAVYTTMWFGPFLSVALFVYLTMYVPVSLIFAVPFIAIWLLGPFVAWFISREASPEKDIVSAEQNIFLRVLGRKIWSFFETFVNEKDNWLPPDNYQEDPVERVAHRTSPTNIGLSLLAILTAHDFGYIVTEEVIMRTTNTLDTLQQMEKYRGHFYNWYDTETLTPLSPRYISTVDSGNLTGHLVTMQQGLLLLADKKIFTERIYEGLLDAMAVLIEKTNASEPLKELYEKIEKGYEDNSQTVAIAKAYLDEIDSFFTKIMIDLDFVPDNEDDIWSQKVMLQITNAKQQLHSFVPWLLLPPPPEKFQHLIDELPPVPTIKQLAKIEQNLLQQIFAAYAADNTSEENEWLTHFRQFITEAGRRGKEILLTLERLANKCASLSIVEYDFLYDRSQHLLTIGYNVDEHRRDNSYYDLLASEARLTTFIAIAQGKLPQESWFSLGRQLTNLGTSPILLSWSGSMFEYLMPLLVMPTYENTLLDQTYKAVIQKQIDYGKKRGVPWGISESGYNMVDAHLNYQYRAFGVPGLGLKRGLGEDLVISPYSTIMSLMIAPQDACDNLQVLKEAGFEGLYGYYEAIDYTASRLLRRQTSSVVKSFMAHHQGMSFLSLGYVLFDKPMQQRFENDVQVKATLLLLQERIPRVTTFYSPGVHTDDSSVNPAIDTSMRVINTPHTSIPEVQLLSNGRYNVMVTNAGGGYSRWKNISLTRWREDCTADNWGTFCYIRDLDNDAFWSSAFQPSLQEGNNYEAVFSQGRAEFRRRDFSLETHTEIVVSPEDDIELRRIHITNRSRKRRTLEITSYAEVVLTIAAADEAHPAFSNLFVQTEINQQRNSIFCTRRPRSVDEQPPWMFHLMKVHDATIENITYETDRDQFIGRGNTINVPKIMRQTNGLSGSSGSVLDPVISIQYRIVIEPQETAIVDMIFGVAETKEACNILVDKYQDRHLTNRVLELVWTHSQVILRQINASEADAQLFSRLASSIIFSNPSLRTDPSTIIKNQRGQSGLWGYSISGDIPIVLLQIEDAANIGLVKQLVQAHAYWRLKGLMVDLVIWNEDHGGYRQVLHNDIQSLVAPGLSGDSKEHPGGIFIRSADQISNEDRILFQTVAHIVISDALGPLEEQMNRRNKLKTSIPYFSPSKFHASVFTSVPAVTNLQFFNGTGGFSPDGKEYVITTTPNRFTPAPWVNVLANPQFGTVVSESGQAYTWTENAHELRLTPWNNDPIGDLKGEAFYLRDEESGKFWSPSPLPVRGLSPYITRHGFGYSIFEHSENGIESSMCMYVDIEAPVKFIVIKVRNNSTRPRRISAIGYVEWVLGDLRAKNLMHTITEIDVPSGAILARNPYNTEFGGRFAFFDVDDINKTHTTDRSEFIGRNGTLNNPDALNRAKLSGKTGAALDPCAAIQVVFDIDEDQDKEIIFRLGAGKNLEDVTSIIRRFGGALAARNALDRVHAFWKKTLGAVQLDTPDRAINILANGWLNYQTLVCRIWARSGFYQSGGAFGFRDQLQDVLSLIHTKPEFLRAQILLCASRQFKQGDVQHWWHPPAGRGVRTTCSDDYLWLPYATIRYVIATGDEAILEEPVHFLEGRLLNEGEESYFDLPIKSDTTSTLYQHCIQAIEHGLRFGVNGLPLMGTGDWNDGMDQVGNQGKGESVWLAFFLYDILVHFKQIAAIKKDTVFVNKCTLEAEKLRLNIDKNAWDGEWYRRAYFDDGTPLGSHENEECRIDSIAQSWSVLSGGGNKERSLAAMQSADKYLVQKEDGIIQLFTPPFDKSAMNPGYIKGYVPGVRENGGQYTHAAIWLVMAFAALNNKKRTWELLQMINPLNRGNTADKIAVYKTEPYVIAADVYAEPLHKGRGGWTWYTGSAGWMYQLILNSFAGLKKEGDHLHFSPCFPETWASVKLTYHYHDTEFGIEIVQQKIDEGQISKLIVNGEEQPGMSFSLSDMLENARSVLTES